jgi:hypothetical protein
MTNPATPSERRFEAYLAAHGYIGDHDVDWRARYGVTTFKRPDYLVSRAREELAICEVKEFTTTKINQCLDLVGSSTSSGAELYGEAADAIQAASLQLRPFADVGRPLVAVLANPHGCIVDLGPRGLTFSMFGATDAVRIPVGPTGRAGNTELIATGAGALYATNAAGRGYNPHPYLSAVAVAHARTEALDFIDAEVARRRPARPPRTWRTANKHAAARLRALNEAEREGRISAGEYEWVTVFDLRAHPEFTGTPLPRHVFDGPRDRLYDLGPGGIFTERARDATAA